MEPLGTGVLEEPTLGETLHKSQKSMDFLMSDYEERKRTRITGRAGYDPESIHVKTEENPFFPPPPSPRVESRDRNGVVSGSVNPDVSNNG